MPMWKWKWKWTRWSQISFFIGRLFFWDKNISSLIIGTSCRQFWSKKWPKDFFIFCKTRRNSKKQKFLGEKKPLCPKNWFLCFWICEKIELGKVEKIVIQVSLIFLIIVSSSFCWLWVLRCLFLWHNLSLIPTSLLRRHWEALGFKPMQHYAEKVITISCWILYSLNSNYYWSNNNTSKVCAGV